MFGFQSDARTLQEVPAVDQVPDICRVLRGYALTGYHSVCLQHGLDHICTILYISYMSLYLSPCHGSEHGCLCVVTFHPTASIYCAALLIRKFLCRLPRVSTHAAAAWPRTCPLQAVIRL